MGTQNLKRQVTSSPESFSADPIKNSKAKVVWFGRGLPNFTGILLLSGFEAGLDKPKAPSGSR